MSLPLKAMLNQTVRAQKPASPSCCAIWNGADLRRITEAQRNALIGLVACMYLERKMATRLRDYDSRAVDLVHRFERMLARQRVSH
jgi:hypothetical protein